MALQGFNMLCSDTVGQTLWSKHCGRNTVVDVLWSHSEALGIAQRKHTNQNVIKYALDEVLA